MVARGRGRENQPANCVSCFADCWKKLINVSPLERMLIDELDREIMSVAKVIMKDFQCTHPFEEKTVIAFRY